MFSRSAVVIFFMTIAEFFTARAVAGRIGWGWTLLLVAIGSLLGIAVLRHQIPALFRSLDPRFAPPSSAAAVDVPTRVLAIVGGAALLLPGLVSSVIGLALISPAAQLLRPLIDRRVERWKTEQIRTFTAGGGGFGGGFMSGTGFSFGGFKADSVVDVDLIDLDNKPDDGTTRSSGRAAPHSRPELD